MYRGQREDVSGCTLTVGHRYACPQDRSETYPLGELVGLVGSERGLEAFDRLEGEGSGETISRAG